VFEPTPDTVIINLEGTRIDPKAAVRIAPEPGGPVSLVTAFGQPELDHPQVRVVVQPLRLPLQDIHRNFLSKR
jgi:hypothetical protein